MDPRGLQRKCPAGAEHTFRGERRPVEIQLEHPSADPLRSGTLFVSLTFTSAHEQGSEPLPDKLPKSAPSGDKDYSAAFAEFLAAVDGKSAEMVDVQSLLAPTGDSDPAYMVYGGSRTAPPCEDAKWFVKRTPVRVSSVQLALMIRASRKAAKDNYRTIMPLPLTTTVSILQPDFAPALGPPSAGAAPQASHGPKLPSGPNPRTDRERNALYATRHAKQVAYALDAKIRSLDGRAQRAAMARRDAFAPTTNPPIDFGRGRMSGKDALVIAESISALAPQLGSDLDHQINALHEQIERAANTGARQVVDNMWDGVKTWYKYHSETTTPVPTQPPRPPPPPPPPPKKKDDFPEAHVNWPLPTPAPTPGPTVAPTPAPDPPHGPTRWPPMTTTAAPATTAPAVAGTAATTAAAAYTAPTTARGYTTGTTAAPTTTFNWALYTTTTGATTTAAPTTTVNYALYTTTAATTTINYALYTTTAATTTGFPYASYTTTPSPYASYTTTGYGTANPFGYTTTGSPFGSTTTGYAAASPYTTTGNPFAATTTTASYLSYGAAGTTTAAAYGTTTAFTTTFTLR